MELLEIYRIYKAAGLTDAGFYGLWGNIVSESGGIPYRLQGDFSAGYSVSRAYTDKVDKGTISKAQFVEYGPNGGGYGLAQWTYKLRKDQYYDFCKGRGKSIGDMATAIAFTLKELREQFPGVLNVLKTSSAISYCSEQVCLYYENPLIKNYGARYQAAVAVKEQVEAALKAEKKEPQKPKSDYWPPRMLDLNMSGPDVFALQGILCARGYYKADINGVYDDRVREAVKAFQRDNGLDADGVCGPMTWTALLKK